MKILATVFFILIGVSQPSMAAEKHAYRLDLGCCYVRGYLPELEKRINGQEYLTNTAMSKIGIYSIVTSSSMSTGTTPEGQISYYYYLNVQSSGKPDTEMGEIIVETKDMNIPYWFVERTLKEILLDLDIAIVHYEVIGRDNENLDSVKLEWKAVH